MCQGGELVIGLKISGDDIVPLQEKINESLTELKEKRNITSIKIKNLSSYSERHDAFINNEVDILETTYKIFHEALQQDKWGVILHSCYATSVDTEAFYSHGLIIANKSENISLKPSEKITAVYAVSPYSSTGFFLQKHLLDGMKLPKTEFVKTPYKIIEKVKSTPGSIGMCGSFTRPDTEQFDILYKSPKVPGQVVIARDSIPTEIINLVKKELINFSVNRFKNHDYQRHFFVGRLPDDYKAYLNLYKKNKKEDEVKVLEEEIELAKKANADLAASNKKIKESKSTTTIIAVFVSVTSVLLISCLIGWVIRKRSKKALIQQHKASFSIQATCSMLAGYNLEQEISERLNEDKINNFFHYYTDTKYKKAIWELAGDLEQSLPLILNKIREIAGRTSSDHEELRDVLVMQRARDLNSQVNSFRDCCYKIRKLLSAHQLKNTNQYGGPFENELAQKLIPLASLDGIIQLLYTYRNFSTHEHIVFLNAEDAETVLRNYLHLYQKICESRIFELPD